MSTTSAVDVRPRPDGVVVCVVDQPGSRANILTPQLWDDLAAAINTVRNQPGTRGLILASGKPGMFIAGADLKFLASVPEPQDAAVEQLMNQGLRVLAALEALPFPTLAAIDGPALGGGFEVALACDNLFCGTNPAIRLGLPEVNLGLIPGWGGTQRLPRRVPLAVAFEILMGGQAYTVPEFHQLTHEAVLQRRPSESLLDSAAEWLLSQTDWPDRRRHHLRPLEESERVPPLPANAGPARQAAWYALDAARKLPLAGGCSVETEEFLKLAGTEECRQLIQQFFASRKK